MAVRVTLPIDIPNTALNIEELNDLKEYLIKVFENPRVMMAYGQSTSQEATLGAFSIRKFVEDYITQVNSNNISKLISKRDSMQTSFQTIQNRDSHKSKVTPHAKPYDHPPNFRRPNGRNELPRQNNFRNSRFRPYSRGRGGIHKKP